MVQDKIMKETCSIYLSDDRRLLCLTVLFSGSVSLRRLCAVSSQNRKQLGLTSWKRSYAHDQSRKKHQCYPHRRWTCVQKSSGAVMMRAFGSRSFAFRKLVERVCSGLIAGYDCHRWLPLLLQPTNVLDTTS